MDEVIAADGGNIPVAGEDKNFDARLGQLQPGSKWDGPAMGGVKSGGLETAAGSSGAADTGHNGIIPGRQVLLL